MEDEKIVELFISRDETALSYTANKYGAQLRGLANSLLADMPAAEECENDTYLQAWGSIPPHEPRQYLFPFLAKITRHLALDMCRRRDAKKRRTPLVELTKEMEQCIPAPGDTQGQVDSVLLSQTVSAWLRTLEPEKRYMFLRRYWYLDSIAEIAGRCGVGKSKVKVTLFRCRDSLREYLKKEGYDL